MHMRVDEACKVLCREVLDAAKAKKFQTRVEEEYRVNMCAIGSERNWTGASALVHNSTRSQRCAVLEQPSTHVFQKRLRLYHEAASHLMAAVSVYDPNIATSAGVQQRGHGILKALQDPGQSARRHGALEEAWRRGHQDLRPRLSRRHQGPCRRSGAPPARTRPSRPCNGCVRHGGCHVHRDANLTRACMARLRRGPCRHRPPPCRAPTRSQRERARGAAQARTPSSPALRGRS